MKICVIGTGYVGLVTGTCFAETGNDVICMDINSEKIATLQSGKVPIFEPGLEEMIRRNVSAGRLRFTSELTSAIEDSLLIFIAVGTPPKEDGSSDLTFVLQAARDVGEAMNGYKMIINKSTVPIGTADRIRQTIADATRFKFDVVSNPEFLKEGAAIDDSMKPDRVIIGTDEVRAAEIMKELYAPFTRTGAPVLIMDTRSAEMTKYAANAMLASRISFMNEMANLCEHVGADIHWVRQGIGLDRRIGSSFLFPGVGYGGSCFPKDVSALISLAREHNYPLRLVGAIQEVNELQKEVLIGKILKFFGSDLPVLLEEQLSKPRQTVPSTAEQAPGEFNSVLDYSQQPALDSVQIPDMAFESAGDRLRVTSPGEGARSLQGRTFAVWGLAFKPSTDDMREAPSQVIINKLLSLGARVQAYDPEAVTEARKIFKDRIEYAESNYEALQGADALVLVTEWNAFRNPDFRKMQSLMKYPVIFDGRNQYNPQEMKQLGFLYFGIGRR